MEQENIQNWIDKGQALIVPERYEEWERCVKIRANDLYNGSELSSALEIMEDLENGMSLEEVINLFNSQNLSEETFSLVRSIVFTFSSKGPEFWEATADGEISSESKQLLEEKKQENDQLAEVNASKTTEKHM